MVACLTKMQMKTKSHIERQLLGMDGEHEDLVRMAQCRYE